MATSDGHHSRNIRDLCSFCLLSWFLIRISITTLFANLNAYFQVEIDETNSWPIEKICQVFDPGKWKRIFRRNLGGHLLFFFKSDNQTLAGNNDARPLYRNKELNRNKSTKIDLVTFFHLKSLARNSQQPT